MNGGTGMMYTFKRSPRGRAKTRMEKLDRCA